MKIKTVSILIVTLLIATVLPVSGNIIESNKTLIPTFYDPMINDFEKVFPNNNQDQESGNKGIININADEAWDFLIDPDDGIQIPIDVRTNSEWNVEHIDTPIPENPRHYPISLLYEQETLNQFLELYAELDIILYCKTGGRSSSAASILDSSDFTGTIYNMVGGIDSWKDKGYPTISGGFLDIEVEKAWEFLNYTGNGIQKPIDVRTYEEWHEEHLATPPPENVTLYPLQDLQQEEKLEEFLDTYIGREIVLYCAVGGRSLEAAEILVDNSFTGTIYNMVGGILAWKAAGYPTTLLIVDAGGPYEVFEDEEIQFQGTVDGGVPPFTFHWDFGNGDTSDLEDPVYIYEEPGVYEVTFSVTDDVENTVVDDTTATINEIPCCFEVLIPSGFGFGLKAEVTEICEESQTDIPWNFEITGGLFLIPISPLSGTTNFESGETKILQVPLIFGLGNIQITFTIGDICEPTVANAFIIGPFVNVK